MARRAPISLGPTGIDLWAGRFLARLARPSVETGANILTWAADENLLLAVVGPTWLGSQLFDPERRIGSGPMHRIGPARADRPQPHTGTNPELRC
jgi:hypothetical protein